MAAQTWEQEIHAGESIVQRVKRELREDREEMRDDYRRMGEEVRSSLEMLQYKEQQNQDRRSGNGIWPTDAGMFRLWRFIKAHVRLNFPINIGCEPVDQGTDPEACKAAKRYLEHELVHSRRKMFADVRDRWIGQAIAMRAGCYRWDFIPDVGDEGEILPRLVDPRMCSWPKGYLTPHDPMCPRFSIVFRIPVNEARRMGWKGADKLKADGGSEEVDAMLASNFGDTSSDRIGDTSDPGPAKDLIGGDGFFTGVMHWYRFDPDVPKPKRPLEAGDQFMKCGTCGLQTPPGSEIGEGMGYPPSAPCSNPLGCLGVMVREDEIEMTLTEAKEAKGKRFVIIALNGSVDKPLVDGPWACPIARSFPIAWLTRYRFPHKRLPESDPAIHWTTTIGRNFTLTAIYKQAHRARGLWLLPEDGLKDRNGFRMDLGDDQDDVAFYDARDFPPQGIQNIPPPPVTESLFALHQMLAGAFKENEGSSDIQLPPENSKDIPVGTIDQLTETGNVPLDDFGQDVYDAEGISFGVLLDNIRWFGTKKKAIRFHNERGQIDWQLVRGADLPDADVIVSAGSRMSQVRREDLQAYQALTALPGPRRRRLAQLMGLDLQIVNDMDDDDLETIKWQAQLDMAAQEIAGQMPQPIEQRMGGGMPNGMPPPATNGSTVA